MLMLVADGKFFLKKISVIPLYVVHWQVEKI